MPFQSLADSPVLACLLDAIKAGVRTAWHGAPAVLLDER